MDVDSWQYRAMRHWIAAGAPFSGKLHNLKTLEVHPQEIIVHRSGEKIPLRAIAHWEDGTIEDVTELCRFSTNDDVIAEVSEEGVVTSHATGDTHVVVAYDKAVVPVAVMQPTSHNLEQLSVLENQRIPSIDWCKPNSTSWGSFPPRCATTRTSSAARHSISPGYCLPRNA